MEARRLAVEVATARVTEVDGRLLTLYRDILKDGRPVTSPVHTRLILLAGLATRPLAVCSYCTGVPVHIRRLLLLGHAFPFQLNLHLR